MTDAETLQQIRDLCNKILEEKWDEKWVEGVMSDSGYYESRARYEERKLVARQLLKLIGD